MAKKDNASNAAGQAATEAPVRNDLKSASLSVGFKYHVYDDGGRVVSPGAPIQVGDISVGTYALRDAGPGATRELGANGSVTPDARITIRDEVKYDSEAIPMVGVEMQGPKFDPAADVSANADYAQDYQAMGLAPGAANTMKQPYARQRNVKLITKGMFVDGQMAEASVSNPFPTSTYRYTGMSQGQAQFADVVAQDLVGTAGNGKAGNFAVRSVTFGVNADGHVNSMSFDVQDIGLAHTDAREIDILEDYGRIMQVNSESDIPKALEKILAKGDDFYTPIADGIAQPARHIAMYRAISDFDGAVVANVLRGFFEAVSGAKQLKKMLGAHQGSLRAANFYGRSKTSPLADPTSQPAHISMSDYPDNWRLHGGHGFGDNSSDWTKIAPYQNVLRGPASLRKARNYMSSLLKSDVIATVLADTVAYLDSADLVTDARFLEYLDALKWSKFEDGTIGGLSGVGLIIPFNPNFYFQLVTDPSPYQDCVIGACNIRSVTSPIAGRISNVTSPLLNAMVKYINEVFGQKFVEVNGGAGSVTIRFTSDITRFDPSALIVAESLKYFQAQPQYINLHYMQYRSVYGDDLRMSPNAKKLDIGFVTGGSFTQGDAAPALSPAKHIVDMWFKYPRAIKAGAKLEHTAASATATIVVQEEAYTPHFGTDTEPTMVWPVIQTGLPMSKSFSEYVSEDPVALAFEACVPMRSRMGQLHVGTIQGDMKAVADELDPANAIPNSGVGFDGSGNGAANVVQYTEKTMFPAFRVRVGDLDGGNAADVDFALWTIKDELSIPTMAGRVTPNTRGIFDTSAAGINDAVINVSMDVATLDNDSLEVDVYPIEDITYGFLRQVPVVNGIVSGQANYADMLMISTRMHVHAQDLGDYLTDLDYVGDTYGIYLPSPMYAGGGHSDASVPDTVLYDGVADMFIVPNAVPTAIVSALAFRDSFINIWDCVTKVDIVSGNTRGPSMFDEVLMTLMGLKYFGIYYFNTFFNKVRAEKYNMHNLPTDYTYERAHVKL